MPSQPIPAHEMCSTTAKIYTKMVSSKNKIKITHIESNVESNIELNIELNIESHEFR